MRAWLKIGRIVGRECLLTKHSRPESSEMLDYITIVFFCVCLIVFVSFSNGIIYYWCTSTVLDLPVCKRGIEKEAKEFYAKYLTVLQITQYKDHYISVSKHVLLKLLSFQLNQPQYVYFKHA